MQIVKQKNKHIEQLKIIIEGMPNSPGVYHYFDEKGEVIYVGKAKQLRKRVNSYFTKLHDYYKLNLLVNKIADIKYVLVNSEQDALLLENNMIKKYQPRYNVLLKDDKSFPYICIKNERFPRVFYTRHNIKDGSLYFGPYTSLRMVRTLLELIKHLFRLRTCFLNLTKENIKAKKFRACLEYHLENCNAPCVAFQTEENYNTTIEEVKNILKGNLNSVLRYLKTKLTYYSDELRFEEAHLIKTKIAHLENYKSKSTIVNPAINNIDVFTIMDDEQFAFINYLKVLNGAIVQVYTTEIKKKLNETQEELLPLAITELRQRLKSTSREVLIPFRLDVEFKGIEFTVPKIGDKKSLLELSERNCKYFRLEKLKHKELSNPNRRTDRLLSIMKNDLRLKVLPVHIECFDNSNIQGTHPVAACVVFKNGKPATKEYRHFNVKTVIGADDFATMEEIVYRRYKRRINERKDLPQLVVIDGGKGQLSSALKSFKKLNIQGKVAIIGIAKKLEEIYYPNDPIPLYIDKKSETLKVIQHIRNEAHRFGIQFHRKKRSQSFIKSELDEIKGIGPKTKEILLIQFKSVEKIKKLENRNLEKAIGTAKGKIVFNYFNKK